MRKEEEEEIELQTIVTLFCLYVIANKNSQKVFNDILQLLANLEKIYLQ